jgi:glycosidase
MKLFRMVVIVTVFFLALPDVFLAQDSVDVTFRYSAPASTVGLEVRGEADNWQNPPAWFMTYAGNNLWTYTARLRVGGHVGGRIPGAYQYKFYHSGIGGGPWPNDPLNHHVNRADHDNSILYVKHPTIYHFLPNQRTGIVREEKPEISAFLFPKVGSAVDTSSISLRVGDRTYSNLGAYYHATTKQFRFRLPDPLANGLHTVRLQAGTTIDSVTITVQAGFVQITNRGNFTTRNPQRTLYGIVQDTSRNDVKIIRNDLDTLTARATGGRFRVVGSLKEGLNTFKAIVRDSNGVLRQSQPVTFTYVVNHTPTARIAFEASSSQIVLSAAQSTDPDSGQTGRLTFQWFVDPANPQPVPGVASSTSPMITIAKPTTPGEYFFGLIARDPDGNRDTTRNYFTILKDGSFQNTTLATVPQWVKKGRVYELFFKSLTPEGTINAALPFLPYFKSLGVNILWVMPVMENAFPMNNTVGTGYNIKNFHKVAPEYGTNEDFKNFVRQAHLHGLKVILDVTPNHTSFMHPFAQEAKTYRENSPYWDFYEHRTITTNTNSLGDCLTPDGFNYYCGFSEQLLNYNWSDIDAHHYMTEVYKSWIKEFNLDGYRYDVYWGPRRRYGEQTVGAALRRALRHIKPDIFLLAEDDGTGPGTEVIYADQHGGADSGYDWNLYWGGIKPFYSRSLDNFHNLVHNAGYNPGPNSSYFRFMENHDEDRIAHIYGSYELTMPVATVLFTVPGIPMIYSGQEVGFGLGIHGYDQRRRGVIIWNTPGRPLLTPHYQKLAHLRAQFSAFSTQQLIRFTSVPTGVYAFARPYPRENGVVAVNVTYNERQVNLTLDGSVLAAPIVSGSIAYANDIYNDTTYHLSFVNGSATLAFRLKPFGSAVFVLSDTLKRLNLPVLVSVERDEAKELVPREFRLYQNYPNPFNSLTRIQFEIPRTADISLKVYSTLGKEILTLRQGVYAPGTYTVDWEGRDSKGEYVASGMYLLRFSAGHSVQTRKLLLIR